MTSSRLPLIAAASITSFAIAAPFATAAERPLRPFTTTSNRPRPRSAPAAAVISKRSCDRSAHPSLSSERTHQPDSPPHAQTSISSSSS